MTRDVGDSGDPCHPPPAPGFHPISLKVTQYTQGPAEGRARLPILAITRFWQFRRSLARSSLPSPSPFIPRHPSLAWVLRCTPEVRQKVYPTPVIANVNP